MTRIIAGKAKGRKLAVPPRGTRPTSDRVREALFSSLESLVDLEGLHVLDLYAGSGALGLEAISRGAAGVALVEADRKAIAAIERNIATAGISGAKCFGMKVDNFAINPLISYDLVFVDPPYEMPESLISRVLVDLANADGIADGGIIVVERAAQGANWQWPEPFDALKEKRYGETVLHFARYARDPHDPPSPHPPQFQ